MKDIELIKKSNVAKDIINKLMANLVSVEIDIIFFKNNELKLDPKAWQENQKNLVEATASKRI